MLAILYDMHGNLPALDAVLEDARARGADRYLLGGDYSAFGAWPADCVARLQDLGDAATWIRGNWERWQADPASVPDAAVLREAGAGVRAALGEELVARLGALPATAELDGTLYCHGSPGSDVESFAPEGGDDDARLLEGVAAPRVVFGHTHLQFSRTTTGGTQLVNPGSVGLPFDGDPRAAYALLEGETLELRRLDYDRERAIAAIEEQRRPWSASTAQRLREARFG